MDAYNRNTAQFSVRNVSVGKGKGFDSPPVDKQSMEKIRLLNTIQKLVIFLKQVYF